MRQARIMPAMPTANRLMATSVGNGVRRCSSTSMTIRLAANRAMRLDQRPRGATMAVAE